MSNFTLKNPEELNQPKSSPEDFISEFTNTVSKNLLTIENTEISRNTNELEDFIKTIREHNGINNQ